MTVELVSFGVFLVVMVSLAFFFCVSGVCSRPETPRLASLSARRMAAPLWGISFGCCFHQPSGTLALEHIKLETRQLKNHKADIGLSLRKKRMH